MTLYEFVNATQRDYDAYDDAYDTSVTVCYIPEDYCKDDYDNFCNELMKKVEFIRQTSDCIVICKWSNLIERNFDKLKAFAQSEWKDSYDDDDEEFICQWIKEFDGYVAGNVPEDYYSTLLKFINTLE